MRVLLLAGAALISAPAAAQDHSGHAGHGAQTQAEEQDDSQHQTHSDHAAMNPSNQADPDADTVDHSTMDHSTMDHSSMDHSSMNQGQMDHSQHGQTPDAGMMAMDAEIPSGPPPARAFEGPQHAADALFDTERMARARSYNHVTHGNMMTGTVLAERLETRFADGEEEYLWDLSAWYGTATDRVVFKSEGEGELGGGVEDAEVQLLWGRAIGPWFDLQAGVRLDVEPDTAAYLALGVAGLAPYMIHVDAAAFVSDDGDLTARVEAEHDVRLTQQLVLQPRVEFELAAQDIPERGIGVGLPKIEAGLRLRYEIVPEFAPYIGVEYEAATGRTADIIRAAGDDPDGVVFMIGLRTWF